MTPPDSGYTGGCDRNGEGRDGCGRPTCGKCYPIKVNAGEREATGTWGLVCPICWTGYAVGFEGRDVGSLCGDESQNQERACVGRLIHGRAFASAEWRQCVPLPLPLAQRILAALEEQIEFVRNSGSDRAPLLGFRIALLTAIAAELREVMGK